MVTASGELLETLKGNIKEKFSQANNLVINPDIVGEAAQAAHMIHLCEEYMTESNSEFCLGT